MEQDIYKTMLELEEKFKYYNNTFDRNVELDDVFYYGKVFAYEEVENTNRIVTNVLDIYIIVEDSNPPIYKFFDGDGNLIAINLNDGRGILPTENFMWGKISKSEFEKMNDTPLKSEKSLNYTRKRIKEMAKELNVPEENILAIYEEASQMDEEKDEKEDDEIQLKNQEKDELGNIKPESQDISAITKQETSLDQRVNDNQTLRDILNLPPDAQKLAFVETDSLVSNSENRDNTRFTPLYKDDKGKLHRIDELEIIGENQNTGKVAASNESGDNVEFTGVNSMFKTKGTTGREYILTANIGSHGVIDLGIGQVDKTQGIRESEINTVTIPLKTDATFYTQRETKQKITNEQDGTRRPEERNYEASIHKKCEHKKDINSVDGKNIEEKKEKAKRVDGEISDKEEATKNTIDNTAANLTFRLLQFRPENLLIRKYYQNDNSKLQNKIQEMLKENPDLISLIDNLDDVENTIRETLNQELLENIEKEEMREKTIWDPQRRKNNYTA